MIDISELLLQLQNNEHSLSGARGALNRIRKESTKWAVVKNNGVSALNSPYQEKTQEIIDKSIKLGLYIVPVGELEGWIDLGVRKNRWIVPALEEIHSGRCPDNLKEFVGQLAISINSQ